MGWHQEELAKRAKIGLATNQRLERAPPGPVMAHVATVVKITDCLKKAGINFIERDTAGGVGAGLTNPAIQQNVHSFLCLAISYLDDVGRRPASCIDRSLKRNLPAIAESAIRAVDDNFEPA